MKYDDMPAGPELDQLVAEKIMGWEIASTKASYRHASPDGGRDTIIMAHEFCPSGNIAHAWRVIEHVVMRNGFASVDSTGMTAEKAWMAKIGHGNALIHGYNALAKTAPLAICRAAMSAYRIG